METLGDYLKNKREVQNITLEEVSQATRIRKTILEAIENNRFDLYRSDNLPPFPEITESCVNPKLCRDILNFEIVYYDTEQESRNDGTATARKPGIRIR